MRISRPDWANWAQRAKKCLDIDTCCTLCARPGTLQADICIACLHQFRTCNGYIDRLGVSASLCLGCGADSGNSQNRYCHECTHRPQRLLQRIVAPYRYDFPVDRLIKRIKYREDRQLARVLGTLLGEAALKDCESPLPQLLLPMPLHASRLRHRGFNQASDIAQWAGRRAGVSVASGQVSRVFDTGSLAGLSRQERHHRILGAFRASEALVGKHVAIVDDVLTTGASARELAREIYDTGAVSVELWVLARTSSLRSGV